MALTLAELDAVLKFKDEASADLARVQRSLDGIALSSREANRVIFPPSSLPLMVATVAVAGASSRRSFLGRLSLAVASLVSA